MVVTTNVAEAVIINTYKVVVVKVVEKSGRPFIASHVDVRARGTLRTLRSNDADDNENVKNTIGVSKTIISHVHHTFFVHFFPVFARLRRENA